MNNITAVNNLDKEALLAAFLKCCASVNWASQLAGCQPFDNKDDLFFNAKNIWFNKCKKEDWLEAFSAHPKIGDINSLAKKYANTKDLAGKEQSGVESASMETLKALAEGNEKYEKKYGYIFIVCATGKSAAEMLDILNSRLYNGPEKEILIAMQEQHKITEIRLNKWFNGLMV